MLQSQKGNHQLEGRRSRNKEKLCSLLIETKLDGAIISMQIAPFWPKPAMDRGKGRAAAVSHSLFPPTTTTATTQDSELLPPTRAQEEEGLFWGRQRMESQPRVGLWGNRLSENSLRSRPLSPLSLPSKLSHFLCRKRPSPEWI